MSAMQALNLNGNPVFSLTQPWRALIESGKFEFQLTIDSIGTRVCFKYYENGVGNGNYQLLSNHNAFRKAIEIGVIRKTQKSHPSSVESSSSEEEPPKEKKAPRDAVPRSPTALSVLDFLDYTSGRKELLKERVQKILNSFSHKKFSLFQKISSNMGIDYSMEDDNSLIRDLINKRSNEVGEIPCALVPKRSMKSIPDDERWNDFALEVNTVVATYFDNYTMWSFREELTESAQRA